MDVAGRLHQRNEAGASSASSPQLIRRAFREMDDLHSGGPCCLVLVCLLLLFGINAALRQFEVVVGFIQRMIEIVLGGESLIRVRAVFRVELQLSALCGCLLHCFDVPPSSRARVAPAALDCDSMLPMSVSTGDAGPQTPRDSSGLALHPRSARTE